MKLMKAPIGRVYYTIVFNEKQKTKFLNKHGIPECAVQSLDTDACMHALEGESGEVFCLIECKNPESSVDYMMLIVHECVHVYQEMIKWCSEESPSAEFEAYSIQEISRNCVNALLKHLA